MRKKEKNVVGKKCIVNKMRKRKERLWEKKVYHKERLWEKKCIIKKMRKRKKKGRGKKSVS